jgi:hypothetical protein
VSAVGLVRRCTCVAIVGAFVGAARAAPADDALTDSEGLIQLGVELRLLGKNREALEAFQRAYALHATPRGAAQIALARQALGDWARAEQGLDQALRAGDDPWIARYRDALEQAVATIRGHLGWLYVEANVTEGEVSMNDADKHTLPVSEPLRVLAGTIALEFRSTGYIPVRRAVEVVPGAATHVVVVLERLPVTPTPAALGSPTVPEGLRAPLDRGPRDARHRAAGYAALAAGGALSVAGLVAWRVREDNVSIYNDDRRCLMGSMTRAEQCARYAQTANVALGVEIGALTAGAVSAAIGAWLLWAPSARPAQGAGAWCAPSTGLAVVCGGAF